jgi:uncharacterized Zn-finger protein
MRLTKKKQPSLSTRHTNWDDFRHLINQRLTLNVSLKPEGGIVKQQSRSSMIQYNGQVGMQHQNIQTHSKTYDCPILIKQKIEAKGRLHRG